MNKDITGDILLRAGFKESVQGFIKINDNEIIAVTEVWRCKPFPNPYREWQVSVFDFRYGQITEADIQTIDHFNKLMELMDIDFRLKENTYSKKKLHYEILLFLAGDIPFRRTYRDKRRIPIRPRRVPFPRAVCGYRDCAVSIL